MAFRALDRRSVRWRPFEGAGLQHLTLRRDQGSIIAQGVVIGERREREYGVRYAVICDPEWHVRLLDLETTDGDHLLYSADGEGRWADEHGVHLEAFDGCLDVDLEGTPFTNTLPIRRLALSPETGAVEIKALYVPFDSFVPFVDEQRYRCLEQDRRYRYEAVDGSFTAEITVDEDGLVTDYPPLFVRI